MCGAERDDEEGKEESEIGGELVAELARKWVGGNDQLGIAELKIY